MDSHSPLVPSTETLRAALEEWLATLPAGAAALEAITAQSAAPGWAVVPAAAGALPIVVHPGDDTYEVNIAVGAHAEWTGVTYDRGALLAVCNAVAAGRVESCWRRVGPLTLGWRVTVAVPGGRWTYTAGVPGLPIGRLDCGAAQPYAPVRRAPGGAS